MQDGKIKLSSQHHEPNRWHHCRPRLSTRQATARTSANDSRVIPTAALLAPALGATSAWHAAADEFRKTIIS